MNYSLPPGIKKYVSNVVYIIIIVLITYLYYNFVFIKYQSVIKSQIEQQFVSDMKMKTLLLDNSISKYIQGVKSISSRSSIRNKIIEYEDGVISFEELKKFAIPKYKDGIKALENIIGARRYIHSEILIEEGKCNKHFDAIIDSTNKQECSVMLIFNDTTLSTHVTFPIYNNGKIIGQDIICFNSNPTLNKIKNSNISFDLLATNNESPKQNFYYKSGNAVCRIKSEYSKYIFQYTISREALFHDLNLFYQSQSIITLLLLTSLILILYIFHRKKQLLSLRKSEYFEVLASKKTAKLNETVHQLLETNKQWQRSEKRFRTIFENNTSIMLIINPKTFFIEDANNAAYKFYGYTKEELTTLKIIDLNQLSNEKITEAVNAVLNNEKAYFNFKHKLSNDEIRDVEIYSSRIEFDNGIKLISIIHDITERKLYREKIERLNSDLSKAIDEHKKLEAKLKAIVNKSPIAIIMSSGKEQKTEYINPVFSKLFGYSETEVPSILDWWPKVIPNRALCNKFTKEWNLKVKQAIKTRTNTPPIETPIKCKDGSIKHIKWGYISTGVQNWAFGVDLTDLRITEKYLRDSKQKIEKNAVLLSELNATKDKFFRIVAHDLKSPFNSIVGLSSILLHNFEEYKSGEIKQHISVINDSAKNTYNLLVNLLEWEQAQSGKTIFKPTHVKANDVVNKTISQLNSVINAKKLKINYCQEDDIHVYADENMLNTILRNIVNNAAKFTHSGGIITLKVTQDHSNTSFLIQDNGIGMSQDTVDKLFRIEEKTTTKGTNNESGTGLGLLLTREFVKKHNGKIFIESEVNKGSVFTIQLPAN